MYNFNSIVFSPIGGCTPVYPEKLNPYLNQDLKTYEDFVLYEPDGPLFEVKTYITMQC